MFVYSSTRGYYARAARWLTVLVVTSDLDHMCRFFNRFVLFNKVPVIVATPFWMGYGIGVPFRTAGLNTGRRDGVM